MAISQNFPDEGPSLNLNFANSRTLDSRITFTRSSTGTYLNENGLITLAAADSPRFDHSYDGNNVESLGLLIEESRTNLLDYSEQLTTNTSLTGTAVTTTTEVTAPDGSTNAYKLNITLGTAGRAAIGKVVTGIMTANVGVTYAQSVFVKAAEVQYATLWYDGGNAGTGYAVTEGPYYGSAEIINLQTGLTITGVASTITQTQQYPNGWWRFSIVGTSATTNTNAKTLRLGIGAANGYNENPPYGAVGTGTNGIYVWGWQFEQGLSPTSYIPTTSATVTRSADDASITGTNFSNWYNQSEGTLIGKLKKTSVGIGLGYEIATFASSNPNRLVINHNLLENVACSISDSTASGATTINLLSTAPLNTDYTIGLAYSPNDSAACYNGNVAIADTIEGATGTMFRLKFGRVSTNYSSVGTGWLDSFKYYPVRLSNDQLQTLTK
jgi:hypothetical protein